MVGFICTFKDKLGQRGSKNFMKLETFLCYSQGESCSKEEVEVTEAKLLSCAFGLEESLGGKTKILST